MIRGENCRRTCEEGLENCRKACEMENCRRTFGIGKDKKGQVTIFVIIAIVIVVAVLIFFAIRSGLFVQGVPVEFAPVYSLYSGCIEQETRNALDILGTQGGRIDTGEYVPGSEYAPFSSHLNFLSIPVPYWYYVAGNNLISENVPSRAEMEEEVSIFLEQEIENCDFTRFYEQGFYVSLPEELDVKTKINANVVEIEVNADVSASREDRSARKTKHKVQVNSKIGKFYDTAVDIYNKQKDEAFLEDYAIDVLRLNAPVDGVEVQCGPKIWTTRDVIGDLEAGLEDNFAAIKFDGDYYKLDEEEDKYFVVDLDVSEPVRVLYSSSWPTKVEVEPADEELMIAEPIGDEEGLGVLGFCYVPYHFVYDVSFPALIQVSDGFEIFQFPVSVIIDNNQPREAELFTVSNVERVDLCEFAEGSARIYTFDNNLNPVEADVKYKCFDQVCRLGRSQITGGDAILDAEVPVCLNGQLIAEAEGFAEAKQLFSSNSESVTDIVLDREYEVEVELRRGGAVLEDNAIVHFSGEDENTKTAIFPDNNEIELKEGQYEISAYVYGDSGIVIPASTKTQCYEVSKGGLFGIFGGTKEECVEIELPGFNVDYALIGGGRLSIYILESELESGRITIDVDSLPHPSSIEELQYNFQAFDTSTLGISFI
jgi:hypothetical protein